MIESSKSALIFDITWFMSFISLQVTSVFFPRAIEYTAGYFTFTLLVGGTMLFSNRIRPISKVGKMLYWFAINVLKPRTKYNHIIWGFFILIFGILAFFFTEEPTEQELARLNDIDKDPTFWLIILVVFALNILSGIYTAKKHEKN